MKFWKTLILLLVAMMSILLIACQTQIVEVTRIVENEVEVTREVEVVEESVTSARGSSGLLTLVYWQAPSILNPYLAVGTKDIEASSIVLEPLARYDEAGKLVPWLAEEIPTVENGGISEDHMSITWRLQEGITWSDGMPLTAEDVVFTAEYCLHPESGCSSITQFADVANVEALDPLTIKVNFTVPKPYPYGPFVAAEAPIIQKNQFADCLGAPAQDCHDQNFRPIGTGPFQVADFQPEQEVLYEANPNYRDIHKPFFSEVILRGSDGAVSAARTVLETGEADYAWNLQVEPQILNEMESAGIGKVVTTFGPSVERLIVNFTNPNPELGERRSEWTADDPNPHPFLTDPAVRRALSLAIDRDAIATQLYGQAGKPTCNIVPAPTIFVSTNNDECLGQNIELANQILDEAGWERGADGIRQKDGVRLSLLFQTSTNAVRQSTQALIEEWWDQIGVETELKDIDGAEFFGSDPESPNTYGKFYADIEMYTQNFSGSDPEPYMAWWQCSEIARRANQWLGNNRPRYCNPEYDALVEELSATTGMEKRAGLVIRLNDMLMQDYVLIPLVHRGAISAHSNTLLGVRMTAWDTELWNIADWSRAGN